MRNHPEPLSPWQILVARVAPVTLRAAALVLLAGAAGCGGLESIADELGAPPARGEACVPGHTVFCACDDGNTGTQRCDANARGYDACACAYAEDADPAGDGAVDISGGPDTIGDPAPVGDPAPWVAPAPAPAPAPAADPPPAPVVPDVDATLTSAQMRIFVVSGPGAAVAAEVNADWSATGTDGLVVDLEVKSSLTYRAWTPILRDQPAVHFATASVQGTPGERRFDYRIVARDAAGHRWESNVITVQ